MRIVPSESRIVVETLARGMLAAAAHDLRIEAPIRAAEVMGEARCVARATVSDMKVIASCRHGTASWHDPNPSDARDIEERIRTQAFPDLGEIVVDATLSSETRATLTVRAARAQTVETSVRVERTPSKTTVHGRCELSLDALGVGKIHVPLGAIKLDDRVTVSFDVTFAPG